MNAVAWFNRSGTVAGVGGIKGNPPASLDLVIPDVDGCSLWQVSYQLLADENPAFNLAEYLSKDTNQELVVTVHADSHGLTFQIGIICAIKIHSGPLGSTVRISVSSYIIGTQKPSTSFQLASTLSHSFS